MNPKITPDIKAALEQHPEGPIRLEGEPGSTPVFLIRLDDIASLQEVIDDRIREKLSAGDNDIENGMLVDWDVEAIKQRGTNRLGRQIEA